MSVSRVDVGRQRRCWRPSRVVFVCRVLREFERSKCSHDSARPARNVDRKRVVNHTAIVRHESHRRTSTRSGTRTPIGKRRAPTDSGASMLRVGAGRWEPQRRMDERQDKRRAEVEKFRAELCEANARAREEAMDRPPPATVRAYRQVYGRDPRGWTPA
jgi:hypothetical protein